MAAHLDVISKCCEARWPNIQGLSPEISTPAPALNRTPEDLVSIPCHPTISRLPWSKMPCLVDGT